MSETVQRARALAVVAHPDDAEFWAGGTIAAWTRAGVEVSYLVITDGDVGGFDLSVPRDEIPYIRRAEQEAAAAVLRVAHVEFLGLSEEEFQPGVALRQEIVHAIRRIRPQRVITWSPEWNWERFRSSHPHHRATGELTLHAVYPDAGNPFVHLPLGDDEQLDAWTVDEVWLMHSPRADRYVDVTDTFGIKVSAVQAHESQVGHRAHLADDLRRRLEANAAVAGWPAGRLAEAFQVVVNR